MKQSRQNAKPLRAEERIKELKDFISAFDEEKKRFLKFCYEKLDWSNPVSCSLAMILGLKDMNRKFRLELEKRVRGLA